MMMMMIMTMISRRDLNGCLVYFRKYYFSVRIGNLMKKKKKFDDDDDDDDDDDNDDGIEERF